MSVAIHNIPEPTRAALIAMERTPIREQAESLGLAYTTVKQYRSAMIKAGLVRPLTKCATAADVRRLRVLAANGYGIAGAAQCLEMSDSQVAELASRHKIRFGHGWWHLTGLESLMGVSEDAITHWRAREWLTPQASSEPRGKRHGYRGIYLRVNHRDLVAFLSIREAWMTYAPEGIQDAELRRIAQMYRDTAGGRWVSAKELAGMAYLHITSLRKRLARGWPGWEMARYGRMRFFWMPTGAALPPYIEQSKARKA